MSTASAAPARKKASFPFWAQVLAGLAAGVLLGWLARTFDVAWLKELLSTVGTIFVQLLRVIVVPLVLTALIVSITQLRHVANAAKLAVQTLVWFAITAFISVVIGIVLGLATNPGKGTGVDTSTAQAVSTQGGWLDFLKSIRTERIIVAAPVASTSAVDRLHVAVDEMYILDSKDNFMGVNHYYDDNVLPSREDTIIKINQIVLNWRLF